MDDYYRPTKQSNNRKPIALGAALFLASCFIFYTIFSGGGPSTPPITKAIVILKGDSEVTGTVTFTQASRTGPVTVTGKVNGLGSSSLHGFHVHELGDTSNGCLSTGPHYNPFNKHHGAPTDKNRHVGDLGNIESNGAGVSTFTIEDSKITLNGPLSIVGRAVVVHAGTDDLGLGGNEESLKTGNAGARAACGVIALA